jgi:hypothetical protein
MQAKCEVDWEAMNDAVSMPFGDQPVAEVPLAEAPLDLVVAQLRFPVIAKLSDQDFIAKSNSSPS